jgi:hypothetical protein
MLLGIAGSWVFLRPQDWNDKSSEEIILANVIETVNDVKRQRQGRYIWETLGQRDVVYVGDRIRTAALSQAVLSLIDDKSRISIEQDSLVFMDKKSDRLSLNMMEGRLFVEQEEGAKSLDVLSGGENVEVKGKVALSVDESGQSNVAVIEGEATAKTQDGIEKKLTRSNFNQLYPTYGELVVPDEEIIIRWKERVPQASFWLGANSQDLKLVTPLAVTETMIKLKPFYGEFYWQLRSGDDASPIMKTIWKKKTPPSPVSPLAGESFLLAKLTSGLDFKWLSLQPVEKWILEISRDQDFKTIVYEQEISGSTFATWRNPVAGSYYWRVSAGKKSGISTPVLLFQILEKDQLMAAQPLIPTHEAILTSDGNLESLELKWRPVDKALSYVVLVRGDMGLNDQLQTTSSFAELKNLKPGRYEWVVKAINTEGESLSPKRSFIVTGLRRLEWEEAPGDVNFVNTPQPLRLRWNGAMEANYSLKISRSSDMRDFDRIMMKGNQYIYRPSEGGRFFFQVEERQGDSVLGKTDVLAVQFKEVPVPGVPKLQREEFLADRAGNVSISSLQLPPSASLWVEVFSEDGKLIDSRNNSEGVVQLTDMKPGGYWIVAYYEDAFKRRGESTKKMRLTVPMQSQIAAPKLKGIKIR